MIFCKEKNQSKKGAEIVKDFLKQTLKIIDEREKVW
jgi:hypothetical protein